MLLTGGDRAIATDTGERHTLRPAIVTVAIAVLAIIAVIPGCAAVNRQWHHDCTVIAKDVLVDTSGTHGPTDAASVRRVSTTCGSFDVQDVVTIGRAAGIWQSLEVGGVYDLKTSGIRLDFPMPMVPTVIEVKASGS